MEQSEVEMVLHEDGVFLRLPSERYHADSALGSTAIKELLHDPLNYFWKSPFNPLAGFEAEADEPKHFRLGKAAHIALLEGVNGDLSTYEQVYGRCPTRATHPDALATTEDIKAALRGYGLSTSAPRKEDLIRRLLTVNPNAEVLDLLQAEWRREGLEPISAAEDARIRILHRIVHASEDRFRLPEGEEQTLSAAFAGGLSEVSVFWTTPEGVRLRARFDKLHAHSIVDLKTFSKWEKNRDFDQSLLREIKQRAYPLQAAAYHVGRIEMRRLVAEGKVFGGSPQERAELEDIAESDSWGWCWVFCVTTNYPHVRGVAMSLADDSLMFGKAVQDREAALSRFLYYKERHGLGDGAFWLDPVGIMDPSEDDWAMA